MPTITATIASGAALSGAVDLQTAPPLQAAYDPTVTGLEMPAAWTAADVTFQVSSDGVTYRDLYKSSGAEAAEAEYKMKVTAGRSYTLPPADFVGNRYLKVRSGTGAAPVNQAADRVLVLIARDF